MTASLERLIALYAQRHGMSVRQARQVAISLYKQRKNLQTQLSL